MTKQTEALEKVPSTEIINRNITSATDTKYLADDLAKFIQENKLFSNIQGKEFVSVEGWQYVGTRLGYVPIVEAIENRSVDKLYKYQVTVRLMDLRTDKTVGMGIALCSNEEATKKYYAEYAILSMAQTRAVGKAYRNMLAWIIRAAGYMPTPLEEMDEIQNAQVVDEKKPAKSEPAKKAEPASSKKQSEVIDAAVENYVDPPAKTEVVPATVNQKTQILLLCNVKCIKPDEKAKMVAKLSTMSTSLADAAIARLKDIIKERGLETGEAASGKQVELAEKLMQSHVFSEEERQPIMQVIATGKMLKSEAMAAIDWLTNEIELRKSIEKSAA